jgi:hypothetical protein
MLTLSSRLILCIVAIVSLSCEGSTEQRHKSFNENAFRESGISEETAKNIALGHLCLDYDLRKFDVTVADRGDSWEVKLTGHERDNLGYGPIVTIRKSNGELIWVEHSK